MRWHRHGNPLLLIESFHLQRPYIHGTIKEAQFDKAFKRPGVLWLESTADLISRTHVVLGRKSIHDGREWQSWFLG